MISEENDHSSDHLAIEMIFNLQPLAVTPAEIPFNYAKTNWKDLDQKLLEYLPQIISMETSPTPNEIDQYAKAITNTITQVIIETTSWKNHAHTAKDGGMRISPKNDRK